MNESGMVPQVREWKQARRTAFVQEALCQYQEQLEERVAERTAELQAGEPRAPV